MGESVEIAEVYCHYRAGGRVYRIVELKRHTGNVVERQKQKIRDGRNNYWVSDKKLGRAVDGELL